MPTVPASDPERSGREPAVHLDHHSPEFARDPAGALRQLRETCPVAWSDTYGGFWALTRYGDVQRVLIDAAGFSSRHDLDESSPFAGVTIPSPPMRFIPVEMDPPEFLGYRRLLNPIFSPAAVERVRPRIVSFADWCLDQVSASGAIDFVTDLASPVPAMITLDILGLPVSDWFRYASTFHNMVAFPPGTSELEDAIATAEKITDGLASLVAERRANPDRPRAGAIDDLVDAEVGGHPIDEERVVDMVRLILAGGIDTTTGAAGGAFLHLGLHPAARRDLSVRPELVATATEEFIRWTTPTPLLGRTATAADELGGRAIAPYDRVMANLYAANRDPEAFADPDDVLLDRYPNRHMSFGWGIHRCVGAHLARVELEVMLERVLVRMPDFAVDPDGVRRYHTAGIQNGFLSVPATFSPTPALGVGLPR
jgi:cytochrome P450